MDAREARRRVLADHGAAGATLDEVLAYTERPFAAPPPSAFPLHDEPHIAAWEDYTREAAAGGACPALARHFVQMRFPIRAGISADAAYVAATRKGRFAEADAFAPGLLLADAGSVQLSLNATIAGRVPVVVAGVRADFVALVQAFTERNEPAEVPASMGACIVNGLNNWDRVAAYRARWEREHPDEAESGWSDEFRRLAAQKPLYQDRFIILSRGPYSAIPASDVGLPESEWLDRSLVIRREHECTHYFTHRVFGVMRNHVVDELVADFVGLLRAFGDYRGSLAARCLGVERFPTIRPDGRLHIYRGTLSDAGVRVVASLAVAAIDNLQTLASRIRTAAADLTALAAITHDLYLLTLEELAAAGMPEQIAGGLA